MHVQKKKKAKKQKKNENIVRFENVYLSLTSLSQKRMYQGSEPIRVEV